MPGHWNDLQRELESIGRPLSDVRGLVLTRGDSDHIGFAERLRQEAGVPVFIHAADAHRVRTGEKPKTPMGPACIGPLLGFFAYGLRKNALRTRYVQEVTAVQDGDVLDLPGSPVVIGMPGHSPGSIAVHIPAADAVFVGDALTPRHVHPAARAPSPRPSLTSRRRRWHPSTGSPRSQHPGYCRGMGRPGTARPPTSPPPSAPPDRERSAD
jgi:glyoxylase-like metal-dependent hydrolase (beta-lactamase superfamily II)